MITKDYADFKILEVINIKREAMQFQTVSKDCYVLSCRISGESMFFYNGESHRVQQGDVLYIPHGFGYCQSCDKEEIIAIHLDISGNVPTDIHIFTPRDRDEMCNLFQSIARHWQEKSPVSRYLCMADLYQIVALSGLADASGAHADYGDISPSVFYLQAHLYDADLSLEAVCRLSSISRTSFIKHFHKHFGCTPVKYISRQRIRKAQLLLCSGLYTREEIASLCGFENVKHFYVVFKKITGCTTGEYLKTAVNLIR